MIPGTSFDLKLTHQIAHKKMKKSIFFPGISYFSNFFFLKYFLVYSLANEKTFFWLAIFYRNKGPKMTFDFEAPWNPAERTF